MSDKILERLKHSTISGNDLRFINEMRLSAERGVGFGFMQQVIEWEWQDRVEFGAWGPEYFSEERKNLSDRIAELERQNARLLADRTGPWARFKEELDEAKPGDIVSLADGTYTSDDLMGPNWPYDAAGNLKGDTLSDADIALDERLEKQQTAADARIARIENDDQ